MDSAGKKLKELREQRNISLEDVYKETKIHTGVLKDIEEDNLGRLAPAYAKSLLRLYAKFLGVDPDNIVKYSGLEEISRQENVFQHTTPQPRKKFQFKLPKIEKKTLVFAISVILIYLIGLTLVKTIKNNKDVSKKIKTEEPGKVTPKEASKTKDKKVAAAPLEKSKTPAALQPIRLGIHAKNNCWLKVVVDSKAVFQGVLKKDKTESWQANKVVELSVGDASLLDIEVNGKVIAPLGRKGQPVKDIKITSEGITVGK